MVNDAYFFRRIGDRVVGRVLQAELQQRAHRWLERLGRASAKWLFEQKYNDRNCFLQLFDARPKLNGIPQVTVSFPKLNGSLGLSLMPV